jgi:hypothetical protein
MRFVRHGVLPLAALAGACTSFGTSGLTGSESRAITPAPASAAAPGAADGGTAPTAADAAAGPSACTPTQFTDTFPGPTLAAAWGQPQIANGGGIGLGDQAQSPPAALVAAGVFPASGAGRARVQHTLPGGAQTVDLTYAMSFDSLPNDVSFDVGCTLELSEDAHTTARARLSDRSAGGTAISGLVASVDVTHDGATDPRVAAPASQVLSNQLGTSVWYTIHIGAILDGAGAHFSFDLTSDILNAHLDPVVVPVAATDAIVVSCGVDDAVVAGPPPNGSYRLLVDDVSVTACTR